MRIAFLTLLLLACGAPALAQTTPPQPPAAQAPAPAPPASPFTTIKVDGTDNIFIFRYQGYQAMFVVTPEGVIVTDPIGYLRPQAVKTYLDEIRKITSAPIKYVVYSHHHFDHIAGGRPFKDLGATFIAQRRAKEHLEALQYADAVIPDEVVDDRRTLTLGGTELELSYVGRNHSDNSLVMRLPKEKLLFAVDFIPIESVNFRNMPDSWPIEWEDSLKKVLAMD
jgi:glyoxylase-like metal-dependent hydrolase (beta-lactamase superfamily II)